MKAAPRMGPLEPTSGCWALLHRRMLRRNDSNYSQFLEQSSSKWGGSHPVIGAKANGLKYIPRVVPLPPQSVLPCYRPSPYKYVAAYSIGLVVESISLIFMLGRVVWLRSKIKHDVPVLEALRTQ